MAIKLGETKVTERDVKEGVKIIWKGNKIAKLIFASGKVVEFRES